MPLQDDLKQMLLDAGAADVGFALADDGDFGDCRYIVSVVVRLSDGVIEEIANGPTHTYFHHYRTVNAFIDSLMLKAGMFLEKAGYRYIPVAASQTINDKGWNYTGRYSHKKAACLAGLGGIGKNTLFLHNRYGSRVRLGTLFTDCPFTVNTARVYSPCGSCSKCVDVCPAGAIRGERWELGTQRDDLLDAEKCSKYMKTHCGHIGRGAVCGLCIEVCPHSREPRDDTQ